MKMISADYLLKNKTKSNLLIQVAGSTKSPNSKYIKLIYLQYQKTHDACQVSTCTVLFNHSSHDISLQYIVFRLTIATGVDRKKREQEKGKASVCEISKIACIIRGPGAFIGHYTKDLVLYLYVVAKNVSEGWNLLKFWYSGKQL